MIEINAPLTGTVWKIEKKTGDTVEEEDVIMILESMKMEIPIEAEDDGTILEICVKEGDPVTEDTVLVKIEED